MHLAFTGILSRPRREAVRAAKRAGAIVHGMPSVKTSVVVRGRPNAQQAAGKEGGLKLMEIKRLREKGHRITLLEEAQFWRLAASRRHYHVSGGSRMAKQEKQFTRKDLIAALNDDLSREYQAIIAYVVYSQTIKGAQYMNIADELTKHAERGAQPCADHRQAHRLPGREDQRHRQAGQAVGQAHRHAAVRSRQRERDRAELPRAGAAVRGPGEYGIAEDIREILRQEQEHQSDLAAALGEDVPDVSKLPKR